MKYINPGLTNLISDPTSCAEVIKDDRLALKGDFEIPALSVNSEDIYIKLEFYLDDENPFEIEFDFFEKYVGTILINVYKGGNSENNFGIKADSGAISGGIIAGETLNYNAWNDIWLHFHKGDYFKEEEAYYEMQFNDYYVKNILGDDFVTPDLTDCAAFKFYYNWDKLGTQPVLISNIIISDEFIDKEEKLISIPISDVETDMTESGTGIYNAIVEDQYILQSVNSTSIIRQYGGKSEVKSIILLGIPAYKSAEGLSTLTFIEKSNDVISENDSATLQAAENSYVVFEKKLEATTIRDLAGKSYGLKVGV